MATPPSTALSLLPTHQINPINNLITNIHTISDSASETPGGSVGPSRQPKRSDRTSGDPTKLSYYHGTAMHDVLVVAKELFIVATFSLGLFFHHQHSPHINLFKTSANDAIVSAVLKELYPSEVDLDSGMTAMVCRQPFYILAFLSEQLV